MPGKQNSECCSMADLHFYPFPPVLFCWLVGKGWGAQDFYTILPQFSPAIARVLTWSLEKTIFLDYSSHNTLAGDGGRYILEKVTSTSSVFSAVPALLNYFENTVLYLQLRYIVWFQALLKSLKAPFAVVNLLKVHFHLGGGKPWHSPSSKILVIVSWTPHIYDAMLLEYVIC